LANKPLAAANVGQVNLKQTRQSPNLKSLPSHILELGGVGQQKKNISFGGVLAEVISPGLTLKETGDSSVGYLAADTSSKPMSAG